MQITPDQGRLHPGAAVSANRGLCSMDQGVAHCGKDSKKRWIGAEAYRAQGGEGRDGLSKKGRARTHRPGSSGQAYKISLRMDIGMGRGRARKKRRLN